MKTIFNLVIACSMAPTISIFPTSPKLPSIGVIVVFVAVKVVGVVVIVGNVGVGVYVVIFIIFLRLLRLPLLVFRSFSVSCMLWSSFKISTWTLSLVVLLSCCSGGVLSSGCYSSIP